MWGLSVKTKKFLTLPDFHKIIKPRWIFNGIPSGSRIFELNEKYVVKALMSSDILSRYSDDISGDHCNNTSDVTIYELVDIISDKLSNGWSDMTAFLTGMNKPQRKLFSSISFHNTIIKSNCKIFP